jgi:hypothetical protein
MNGNCICDRLTDGRTDGLRNGEETKSPLRLAGWGLTNCSTIFFDAGIVLLVCLVDWDS